MEALRIALEVNTDRCQFGYNINHQTLVMLLKMLRGARSRIEIITYQRNRGALRIACKHLVLAVDIENHAVGFLATAEVTTVHIQSTKAVYSVCRGSNFFY